MADVIHKFRDWAQREESKLVEWWYDFVQLCWLQDRGLWPPRDLELVALLLGILGIVAVLALGIWTEYRS